MIRKLRLTIRIKSAALKVLKSELMPRELLGVLPAMARMTGSGEPWAGLPPAETEKDKQSRALIGEAILLYRALTKLRGQTDAEKIVRRVITESAIAQLRTLIPQIPKRDIDAMTLDEKSRRFNAIVEQFPNADWEPVTVSDEEFGIAITRCRLAELVGAAGHPELRDAFCAGDALYFERCQPAIAFSRTSKIADGDKTCLFVFGIAENNTK